MNDHKGKNMQDKLEPRRRGVLRLMGNGRRLWLVLTFFAVGIILIAIWLTAVRGSDEPMSNLATFVAVRGTLTISVLESGTIQAREQITLRNEVEGRTSIVSLVAEGTRVKVGDLLVELDASTLKDALIDQEIQVQRASAAYISAKETLAVVENQAKSDMDVAKLKFKFAQQDLGQYEEGIYPKDVNEFTANIRLAEEELKRAEDVNDWSKTLYEKKYLSESEYVADKLNVQRRKLERDLAKSNLDLLSNFTYHRQIDQLTSDANQAEMALQRTERKAAADVVQAKADLTAKELEDQRQQEKLRKIEDQLRKTKIYAPTDGMVVYATTSEGHGPFDRREPMDIGVEVTERQDLIQLPTTSSVKAELGVHETSLEKVRVGLPAVITVDALPGKKFLGRLERIAPLPDARSMWMNPDLKVYNTEIYLEDNDSALRTGMSCKAEIIVAQYKDVVYIPVQAVLRVGGEPTVYVVKNGSIEERKVEVGLDDNRMIRIISGLDEGEVVSMIPPLKSATIESGSQISDTESPDSSDTFGQRVSQKLEEANSNVSGLGEGSLKDPSSEQMEQKRQRIDDTSTEGLEGVQQRFQGTESRQGTDDQRQRESQRPAGSERNQ